MECLEDEVRRLTIVASNHRGRGHKLSAKVKMLEGLLERFKDQVKSTSGPCESPTLTGSIEYTEIYECGNCNSCRGRALLNEVKDESVSS